MTGADEKQYYMQKCLDMIASRTKSVDIPAGIAQCASLNDYGLFFGTDKSSEVHNLCGIYENFLNNMREKIFNLYEFGVKEFSSLNMWAAYFSKASIFGIDPYSEPYKDNIKCSNIRYYPMDAYDAGAMSWLFKKYPPMIIVDDATHFWSHQISAFQNYFPYLLPNGWYIVEDIETSYGDFRKSFWADQELDAAAYFLVLSRYLAGSESSRPSAEESEQLGVDLQQIESIIFIRNSVLIKKREN